MNEKKPEPTDGVPTFPGAPKPSLGSKEVVDRVAAFTKPRLPPPVDVFTGKKACHHFFVPVHYFEPSALKGSADLKSLVANTSCIGKLCALWNEERLECLEATKLKADIRVPELLEQIDGFMRIHSSESD
ncbi:MAG TPA: hypothetical protein VN915_06720 [Elusimicrobiota bacterium]|nr:hypothetical protein [Elusimicrobiota bacterium]